VTSALSHLECSRDGSRHDADVVQGTSPLGAPLLARYDLARVAETVTREDVAGRAPTLWRYAELLPVRDPRHVVSLGEGMTPLLDLPAAGARLGVPTLRMKDEAMLPTGTFKARGAAVGVSRARELGVKGIAMPTNGNAGAAWALYGARAGLTATVVMPVDAPEITRRECAASGADLHLVDGLISDAGRIVGELVAASGGRVFDASTLKEPYRIEGKKTMGLEIVEQLGWTQPDVILYPTGGGVGLIGIHKALTELRELGWISGPFPRLVAVQAEGCAPVVEAFERGERVTRPWEKASTVAFGINVPKPLGDFLILDALEETSGTAVAVTDAELLAELGEVTALEGAFVCPEGAAAFAAARRLRASGWLGRDERVVVLNTGAGLKYPETVSVAAPVLPVDGHLA
jgi:threonine synthase